jgi:hypothetical protein
MSHISEIIDQLLEDVRRNIITLEEAGLWIDQYEAEQRQAEHFWWETEPVYNPFKKREIDCTSGVFVLNENGVCDDNVVYVNFNTGEKHANKDRGSG